MIYCNNCGVSLDDETTQCPLCHETVHNDGTQNINRTGAVLANKFSCPPRKMTRPQKKIVWEIVSITIISMVVVNVLIDLIINKQITWSQYPVSVCMILFSYISSFAFSKQNTTLKIIFGILASTVSLILVDSLVDGISWSVKLAIPLLLSGNLIAGLLLVVIKKSKRKGINLIAYFFMAVALYVLCIEAILSIYKTGTIQLYWSIIVLVCMFPVALVLFFVHYRLTKTQNLERIFHI